MPSYLPSIMLTSSYVFLNGYNFKRFLILSNISLASLSDIIRRPAVAFNENLVNLWYSFGITPKAESNNGLIDSID